MKRQIQTGLFLAIFISSIASAEVKGQFKLNGKAVISPKNAAAYPVRNQFNPREWQVEIVLAEGEVDTKSIMEAVDPHTDVINQKGVTSGNYILLWIDSKGQVSMNATLSETMGQYLDSTKLESLKADGVVNTAEKVGGHVYTAKSVKTLSGEMYEIDVTFDTPITRAPAGTKIPAGGGEAGAAFLALHKAVGASDAKGIQVVLSDALNQSYFPDYGTPEENLASAVDILKVRLPKKNLKITGGEMRGDRALLEVEGEAFEGTNGVYVVDMLKSANGWKYQQSYLMGLLK
jgi:hypothetical protein